MFKFKVLKLFIALIISTVASGDKYEFIQQRLQLSNPGGITQDDANWLPNSEKIGGGYDLARGSPVCYTADCQMEGFRRPIFLLNYTKRTSGSCVNKVIPENTNIDCLSSTDTTSNTEIISTLNQFQESITQGIDVTADVSVSHATFSASFSYSRSVQTRSMVDTIVRRNSTVLFTTLKVSWVRLSLFEPKMQLSPDFIFVIENVPCCHYNATVEEYVFKYIIGYFGYTYITELLLGGIAQQRTVITQSDRSNLEKNGWTVSNEASIRVAAQQIFSAGLKVKTTETYDRQKLDTFSQYTQQGRITTLGGDISLQSFEEWSKTVKSNPTIVKFGVAWIFDLLTAQRFPTDPNIAMKARLIKMAVEKYAENPLYCYNQCTHPSHGTCVDSGYFQFGICKCHNGWTGLDCSIETDTQVRSHTETHGVCTIWGGSHLVGFPMSVQQANLRSSFWCRGARRILAVKNAFLELYVNVTQNPHWIEYYEINLLSTGLKVCTITPDNDNCTFDRVEIKRARDSLNTKQILYYSADRTEISIYTQWINNRFVYNLEVIQSYFLIRASSGLCITRLRQCQLESSPRRKRTTSEILANEVCTLFVDEAKKSAEQLVGGTNSPMVGHAREACITDVIETGNTAWGDSAVWLVLTDRIRQARLSNSQRVEMISQIMAVIADAVRRAKPRAEFILRVG